MSKIVDRILAGEEVRQVMLAVESIAIQSSKDSPEEQVDLSYLGFDDLIKKYAPIAYKKYAERYRGRWAGKTDFSHKSLSGANDAGPVLPEVAKALVSELKANDSKVDDYDIKTTRKLITVLSYPNPYQM